MEYDGNINTVKTEVKREANAPDASQEGKGFDMAQSTLEPGAMYICANCTAMLRLTTSSALQCPNCEHITGSSSVFYKVRTQATTYDTI